MLLNWKPFFQRVSGALAGANQASLAYLNGGISRWEGEGRLTPTEGEALRTYLASGEVRNALDHLGAHLVLSVAIVVPIPGLRSLARLAWTVTFWGKALMRRFRHRTKTPKESVPNIHNALVMLLSIIPVLGAVAYLAAPPLRKKLLIRLMLDQIATELPFKLYRRLQFGRWLALSPKSDQLRGPGTLSPKTRELASMPPLKLANATPHGSGESVGNTPVTSWSGRDRLPAH